MRILQFKVAGQNLSKGDKVTHNGKTWQSTTDNNVWEPGVYGWEEVHTN